MEILRAETNEFPHLKVCIYRYFVFNQFENFTRLMMVQQIILHHHQPLMMMKMNVRMLVQLMIKEHQQQNLP